MSLVFKKKQKTIEIISKKDDAIEIDEQGNKKIIEGKYPHIWIFKNPKLKDYQYDYLELVIKIKSLYEINDNSDDTIQTKLSRLPEEQQVKIIKNTNQIQVQIINLLLIGYKYISDDIVILTGDERKEIIDFFNEEDIIQDFIIEIQKSSETNIEKKS